MHRRFALAAVLLLLAVSHPGAAGARARLVSVVPLDHGCVGTPVEPKDECWAVQPGMSYTLRLDRVLEFGNAGMDHFLDVLLANTSRGDVPVLATRVATGVYEFQYTVSAGACETLHVRYGVTRGVPGSGLVVGRHDDGSSKSQLRACTFGPGCSNPLPIYCPTPTLPSTWGMLKSAYR